MGAASTLRKFVNVRKFAAFKHVEEGNFWRRGGCSLLLMAICLVMVSCSSSSSSNNSSPPPTATLTATPNSVFLGASTTVTLVFTSTNADSGTISGQGPVGINSKITIPEPNATTTYTYTATGTGGTATASATVTVNPAPVLSVSLTASPTAALAGTSLTLTWASQNATSVTISGIPGQGGPVGVNPPSGGNYSFTPTATTTYTATAYGADGQQPVTFDVKVPVNPVTMFDGLTQTDGVVGDDVDPNGAVGTKQFMEYINTYYQAYDKVTHAPVWSMKQNIGVPWTNVPQTECAGKEIRLDAVINFDRLASRWVIAAKTTNQNTGFQFCIAVSSTDDLSSPSLTWYAYSLDLDPYLTKNGMQNVYLPDWPKIGTAPEAYYATMDLNDPNNGDAESGILVCAFDRVNILINSPTPNPPQCIPVVKTPLSGGLYLGHSLIPADVDGTTPPPAGRDEFMVSIENPVNDGITTTSTTFNLWDCSLSWSPASFSCSQTPITVPAYTPGCYLVAPGFPSVTNCVQEPGSGGFPQVVDSVGDRLMPRFSYRNFGTYESYLMSQTVQTGMGSGQDSLQTGILWYELRSSDPATPPSIYQQGLIGPADNLFRFLPSIAQDKVGNAAVGYSVSNTFTNPGIDVSYWNLTSATVPAEDSVLAGPGEEINLIAPYASPWGTYASMTVDPVDDCTFWYVDEYFLADSTWSTKLVSFQVPGCQ